MKYLNLDEFGSFKTQLREQKKDFELIETTYTKRVNLEKQKFLFSNDRSDYRELKLINLTKRDCLNFCDNNKLQEIHETQIDFYKFYSKNIFNNEYKKVYKVDLSSAYWSYAINQNILSNETIDYFETNKDFFINGHKKARLKALGSCATKKLKTQFKEGYQVGYPRIDVNDILRNLYLNICNEIDKIMQSISIRFSKECIYYYWDCLFLESSVNLDEVISFINYLGFKTSFENSVIVANLNYLPQIRDIKTNTTYPINTNDL